MRQAATITPYQGGYLVLSEQDHSDKARLTRLDGNLDPLWSRCGGGIVVSRDRAQTAYLSGSCDTRRYTLSVGPTNGVDEQSAGPAVSVMGILDDDRVVYAAEARADFGMLVSDLAGAPEPVTPPGGPVDLDEAHELVAGVEDMESPLTALAWRLATGEVTWRGAQGAGTTWIPSRFSPDGLHLLAAADDGTGMRNGFLDAATGAYVSDFELPPDVRMHDAAWEDDQHVLVSVSEGLARAILRVDLDGRITRAADGTERSPYNFAVRSRLTRSPRVCNLPPPFRVLVAMGWRCAVEHGATHSPGAGVTMGERPRARDADFSAYMAARQPSLLRTAYLLTGDRHTAEDLVQTAFAKLYLSWDKVQRRDSVDGYVRRILVNEHNSLWRRAWKRREHATDELPERPAPRRATTTASAARSGRSCRRSPQGARGRRAALLRGDERGRDRGRARHLRRHRQVPDQPSAGRPARTRAPDPEPPRKRGGRPMNTTTTS